MVNEVLAAAELLEEQGVSARVLKLNSIRPLDMGPILGAAAETGRILVAEECTASGCVGERIAAALLERGSAPAAFAPWPSQAWATALCPRGLCPSCAGSAG